MAGRPKIVVIVQARMGSSRLPGKVLLPAAGKPMLGHQIDRLRHVRNCDQIVVATSYRSADNAIVEFVTGHGIPVYRGSEEDVLSRFAGAAAEHDADVIVRLTGDCPLIDPKVVDEVVATYLESPGDWCYVSNTLERTYPRGMDVEVFSRFLLAWANCRATTPREREHVTPFMVCSAGGGIIRRNVANGQNFSAYRVTLDYPKDYTQLSRLLEAGLPDYSWSTVLSRSAELGLDWHDNAEELELSVQYERREPRGHRQQLSRFGLGTAQFGMFYGHFNRDGVPSRESVGLILRRAREIGLSVIDTARHYGESEFVLGQCRDELAKFDVITKTPVFHGERLTAEDARTLRTSFDISRDLMRLPSVGGLLVHHASDLLMPGGEFLYEELLRLKDEGYVRRIGVSGYSGEIVERIIEKYPVDLVQLPINVLDHRLLTTGALTRITRRGVEVHARSIFLQGLLLTDPDALPERFGHARGTLAAFRAAAREAGVSPAHAALHFALRIPEISRIIVGVESVAQFDDLFANFPDDPGMDYGEFRIDKIEVLNPVFWVK